MQVSLELILVKFLQIHVHEGLTSETSVSDTPNFHGVKLSIQFPFVTFIESALYFIASMSVVYL